MEHQTFTPHHDANSNGPGFIAWLVFILWFLLTIMAAPAVRAEETTAPSVVLSASDILPDIEAALSAHGMAAGAEITLNDPHQRFSSSGAVAIGHVSFNSLSGRFVVRLQNAPVAIAGVARTMENFPVLTRAIERGEVINETDIDYIESAGNRPGLFIRDADALIGKQARRPLRAQAPLRTSDVAAPILVKKGALVTLTYAIKGLRLSHQGVAMSDGAAGDVIAVRNIQSDRVLKGVIDSENLIRIAAPRAPVPTVEG